MQSKTYVPVLPDRFFPKRYTALALDEENARTQIASFMLKNGEMRLFKQWLHKGRPIKLLSDYQGEL